MSDDVRKAAALAARKLLEAARQVPDVREMMVAICGRHGYPNVVELADAEPEAVIELWEAVELLEDGSYDAVARRTKGAG